jgi:HPt (histidine-containing phosphotransfer) domain-containing protein
MPPAAVKKLASTFMTNQARDLEAMRGDIADNDRETLRRRAHSLKGAARLLGANTLAEAAMAFESVALTVEPGPAIEHLTELERLFAEASRDIAAKLSALSVAA